jgi:hypothetical protein
MMSILFQIVTGMDSNSMVTLLKGMLLHIVADLDNRASYKMTMEDFKGLVSKLSVPLQEQDKGGTRVSSNQLATIISLSTGAGKVSDLEYH